MELHSPHGSAHVTVLSDERSITLGSVYETVVASELIAHGFTLFYYDNRSKGEVDYLIDDYAPLSTVPIEVKSGKDYTVHSALNAFTQNEDYHVLLPGFGTEYGLAILIGTL